MTEIEKRLNNLEVLVAVQAQLLIQMLPPETREQYGEAMDSFVEKASEYGSPIIEALTMLMDVEPVKRSEEDE